MTLIFKECAEMQEVPQDLPTEAELVPNSTKRVEPHTNVVTCCARLHGTTTMLALVGTCCVQFKTVQLLAQQVPTFLLFCDRRSVAQQCCVRLHGTPTMLAS